MCLVPGAYFSYLVLRFFVHLKIQGLLILRDNTTIQHEGSEHDFVYDRHSTDRASARNGHHGMWDSREVSFADAILVAAFDRHHPQACEVIYAEGIRPIDSPVVLERLVCDDEFFHQACEAGEAVVNVHETVFSDLIEHVRERSPGVVRYSVKCDRERPERLWCVAGYFCDGLFCSEKAAGLDCFLERWIRYFNRPSERGLIRLVIDHDDNIILINESGERLLDDWGIEVGGLSEVIQSVIDQRYPDLCDDESHDMVITLGGRLWWVGYEMHHPLGIAEGEQRHVEMRQVEDGEAGAVGLVEDERIAKAIAFLHDHYQESPGLKEVSIASDMSFFYCHRLFKEHTGMTPKHYLWQIQMLHGKWLLKNSLIPISQIARMVGYENHGHFSSLFTRLNGMNPRNYRKMRQVVRGYLSE